MKVSKSEAVCSRAKGLCLLMKSLSSFGRFRSIACSYDVKALELRINRKHQKQEIIPS